MFFILSKVLLAFIFPLTWVFGLMVYGLFTKNVKRKKTLLISAFILLCFFGNRFTAGAIAGLWDSTPFKPSSQKYSAVIVLGGFVSEGQNGQGYFNGASERFSTATKLLADGTARHLLFTGGNADINPDNFSEAQFVGRQLKNLNFADSLILLDGKARNTRENAINAKALLEKAHLKPPYLLVTSAFHMRRANLIFVKAGLNVVPYPCGYEAKGSILPADFIPGTEALGQWNVYMKEMVGYLIATLK
jgi:uncharacterized SAM-binding protein YcdF (DUF218 family)